MAMQNKRAPDTATVMEQLMIQAAQAWQNMIRSAQESEAWQPAEDKQGRADTPKEGKWDPERLKMDTALKNWRSLFESLSGPETQASAFMGFGSTPDFVSQIADSSYKHFANLQQMWADQLQRTGEFSHVEDFSNLDREALKSWSEYYEREIRKFLNIPQLGLSRYHQERINRMIDSYNTMQLSVSEFYNLLFTPIQDSAVRMQEQIARWTEEGRLPDDPKSFYRHWIKILEGRYMELFKSTDYLQALQKALNSNLEYRKARREVLEDLFRYFSMPTSRDLDEVYQELYNLKKQVKNLEQQLQERQPEHAAATG